MNTKLIFLIFVMMAVMAVGVSAVTTTGNLSAGVCDANCTIYSDSPARVQLNHAPQGTSWMTDLLVWFNLDTNSSIQNSYQNGINYTITRTAGGMNYTSDGIFNGAYYGPRGAFTRSNITGINIKDRTISQYIRVQDDIANAALAQGTNTIFAESANPRLTGFIRNYSISNLSNIRCDLVNSTGGTVVLILNWNFTGRPSLFLTCIYNSSTLSMYIDGVFNQSFSANIPSTNKTYLEMTWFDNAYYTGDEFMFWNRSLTSDEVSAVYNHTYSKLSLYTINPTFASIQYPVSLNLTGNIPTNTSIETIITSGTTSTTCNSLNCDLSSLAKTATPQISYKLISSLNGTAAPTLYSMTLTTDLGSTLIYGNKSNAKGIIQDDYYGFNTHRFLNQNLSLYNNTGANGLISNYEWHRDKLIESNATYTRRDMNLDSYSTAFGVWNNDLSEELDTVKWAYNNNVKILYIVDYMPNWLANNTEPGICTNNRSCPALNNTQFALTALEFFEKVTLNNTYNNVELEVWNEPDAAKYYFDGTTFTTNCSLKSYYYNLMYEEVYDIIKAKYPLIQIGGMGMTDGLASGLSCAQTMFLGWLGNFSDKADFFSYHYYDLDYALPLEKAIRANMTLKSATFNRTLVTEWNIGNANEKVNLTSIYKKDLANLYIDMLSYNPDRMQLLLYQWAEQRNYTTTNTSAYPGFPQRWEAVSEPLLSNSLWSGYNITKLFATYHKPTNIVYNVTSNNDYIKAVVSDNVITVVNSYDNNITTSIQISDIAIKYLKDVETDEIFNIQSGSFDVGELDTNEIKTYELLSGLTMPTITSSSPCVVYSDTFSGSGYNVTYSYLSNTLARNVTREGLSGQKSLSDWQSTWAVVIGAAIILGLIGGFYFIKKQ